MIFLTGFPIPAR
ncbi:rCG57133 [Rattus norvegicus]|uniref:RCG57133 n=1 Tax=Rattus norvegicus TaxID=10116 RepID=A6JDD1_RAT|nr:rCG57133 [Rattus norvegicus]